MAYPRLAKDAVPSIFANCPFYKSSVPDNINGFSSLEELWTKPGLKLLRETWSIDKKPTHFLFSLFELSPCPSVVSSVLIDVDLKVNVYIQGVPVQKLKDSFKLPEMGTDFRVLENILQRVVNQSEIKDANDVNFEAIYNSVQCVDHLPVLIYLSGYCVLNIFKR